MCKPVSARNADTNLRQKLALSGGENKWKQQ